MAPVRTVVAWMQKEKKKKSEMRNQCHVLSYTPSHDPTSLQHPLPYGGGGICRMKK